MTETPLRIAVEKKCTGSYNQVSLGVQLASSMAGSRGLLMPGQNTSSIQ